ncbi:NAD(P)-dependent dehydrogenase (short-subunit alcohol dehydrogenase family) [Paracoccus lutimaris]|uniref:NAD(P)-dependent dehydrogenase (Short-subunit alcohol dehydrogenase family) n=2 Tax=Paracoccus lutimaris TaxID=1490030 RepID=A0A368Z5N4_9RHOB|nr:NAD(P)-dependent dehydrogenase (short-subunit alcohol dehydrogenase family) [Paracoccus lutimaris]
MERMRDISETHAGAFTGRRYLVTGGSRGIAAAIASALGEAGAQVIINHAARLDAAAGQPDAAEKLARHIAARGQKPELLDADLAQPGAGAALAQAVLAGGPVDGVILSASAQINKPLPEQSAAEIALQLQVNLTANLSLLQVLAPVMAARGFGRVLSIGSVQERSPSPEMPVYAMTKAAMRNLMDNLAGQYAARGVTFNTLSPGLIETDRNAFRRADPAAWAELTRRANPLGRAGQPDEMVAPALMFLSPAAGFLTGAALMITGGAHLGLQAAPAVD